ncbi:hypothetical protein [Pseudactinotalea suaedae]|uniref:arsenate reductase/protein-tyrosine-phosphatase family protein n=1 Tax=Pseudactinotalea suaedae TaxID=1524924 RepID=UPI0012E0E585|nr:hypothetical protein [Pseudactinotalea suaedae]
MLRDPQANGTTADRAAHARPGSDAARLDHVLFVCTGNVCRSPYMEMVVTAALAAGGTSTVRVGSAGTAALEGHAMSAPILAALKARGIDGSDFRARQLTAGMLQRSGIIVTAAREHRRWVTRLDPSAAARTFTLFQVSRLIGAVDRDALAEADGLDHVVRLLNAARGAGGAGSSGDDIEDPWQRSARIYRRVTRRIDTAIEPFAQALVGQP